MLDFDGTRKARRRDAALAAVILVLALVLLALPPEYQRPVRNAVRTTVLRPFLAAQSQVVQRRTRLADVGTLRAQRDSLAALVAAQATLSEENRQLRTALSLTQRLGESFHSANVLRVPLTSSESTFLIDIGSEQGVYVGSPVITAEGLLGVVLEVDANSSQVMDWTHGDFQVSAMTSDGDAYGMVVSRQGERREQDLLALTGTAFQVDVRPGQRIVTSGRGQLIPRGIPLGAVLGIEEADTGWRKSYLLRPSVRPESARHVLVATKQERDMSDVWNVTAPPDSLMRDSVAGPAGGTN